MKKIDAAKKQTPRDPERLAVTRAGSLQHEALNGILDEDNEQNSKRVKGPRKRFELALPVVSMFFKKLKSKKTKKKKAIKKGATFGKNESEDGIISELRDALTRPIVRAAEKANLDVDDELDKQILMCMLAWSIYGGKGPGRGKTWVDDKQRQLMTDFEAVRLDSPNLKGEEAVCKILCSRKSNFPQYQGLTPRTLRRRLQEAKKLQYLDQEEAKAKKLLLTSKSVNS